MAGPFEKANELAVLMAARQPHWKEILGSGGEIASELSGAPVNGEADGVYLENSPKTLLWVKLRENTAYQTWYVTITADPATVYRLVINGGSNLDYDSSSGDGSEATILAGLKAAIEADSPGADDVVTATVGTDPDGNAALVLTGKAEADYTVVESIFSGSGLIETDGDATTADVRVWFYPRQGLADGDRPEDWLSMPDLVWTGVTYEGLLQRLDTGMLKRGYVQISGEDGRVRAWLAPAILEDN